MVFLLDLSCPLPPSLSPGSLSSFRSFSRFSREQRAESQPQISSSGNRPRRSLVLWFLEKGATRKNCDGEGDSVEEEESRLKETLLLLLLLQQQQQRVCNGGGDIRSRVFRDDNDDDDDDAPLRPRSRSIESSISLFLFLFILIQRSNTRLKFRATKFHLYDLSLSGLDEFALFLSRVAILGRPRYAS